MVIQNTLRVCQIYLDTRDKIWFEILINIDFWLQTWQIIIAISAKTLNEVLNV